MSKNDPSWDFVQALVNQLPKYDEAILRDLAPTDGWLKPKPWLDHLAEDARFLPKRLVSVYLLRIERPLMREWQIGRRLHLKTKTVTSRLDLAWDIVDEEVRAWLKTLPKRQRRREVYKRRKTWRESHWQSQASKASDRFKGVWPDLKSEWPPVSKLNCVGEPCDPWAPMRHWDN